MLLVVLGAGASYDSVPSFPPPNPGSGMYAAQMANPWEDKRPPLADQLFLNRPVLREGIRSFPTLHPIVPLLQRRLEKVSLEQQMQALAREAPDYPQRYRQLMAVRYYLQYIFWRNERTWLEDEGLNITNYRALLDRVDRWRKSDEPVCLVTFNYDRMIETALTLSGVKVDTISCYVARSASSSSKCMARTTGYGQ